MALAIIDTETDGPPNDARTRVVEIGAVALDPHHDYAEVSSWASFVHPADFDERGAEFLRKRGIVPVEAVLGAQGDADVRRSLYAWMAAYNVTEVWSYNRAFDESMLRRSGFSLPWTGCVMRMARTAMPLRKKDPPLFEALGFFDGDPPTDAHRALPDARAAAHVFRAIRRRRAA